MQSPYQLKHSDFTDEVAIVCPRCAGKALVKGPGLFKEHADELTYKVCVLCGHNQKYKNHWLRIKVLGGGIDPFFHHPLWYVADCLEGAVWAYNLEHLEVIERFIASTNRSRNGLPYKNNSIASRLPKWMSAAKNRGAVLKVIRELKAKGPYTARKGPQH